MPKKKGNIDTRVSLKLSFIRLRIPIKIWHFLIFTLKIYMLGDKQDKLRNQFLVLQRKNYNSKTFLTVCIYTMSRTFAMFQENIPSLSFLVSSLNTYRSCQFPHLVALKSITRLRFFKYICKCFYIIFYLICTTIAIFITL